MSKAVLSKFLVDRIHKDWIDRLFPQGWEIEKRVDNEGGDTNRAGDINNNVIVPSNFPENFRNV